MRSVSWMTQQLEGTETGRTRKILYLVLAICQALDKGAFHLISIFRVIALQAFCYLCIQMSKVRFCKMKSLVQSHPIIKQHS